MDVREKLVVLLKSQFYDEYEFEAIADDLISQGVTVQECGHWQIIADDYYCEMMRCSVCGSEFYDGDNDTVDCLHNYCPHCGARMMPQPPKGE